MLNVVVGTLTGFDWCLSIDFSKSPYTPAIASQVFACQCLVGGRTPATLLSLLAPKMVEEKQEMLLQQFCFLLQELVK